MKCSESYENIVKIYNLDHNKIPVKFIQGRLDEVNNQTNSITVTCPNGENQELHFDALVLATGANYNSPWRDGPDEMKSMADRSDDYKKVRDQISSSGSVLIGGAGATGLESAGYIKGKNPNLKVGVCLRGKKILPYVKNAHDQVVKVFKDLDINIHFETAF